MKLPKPWPNAWTSVWVFRGVPESNGTLAEYLALDMIMGASADLIDRLSGGELLALGISCLDSPFVDLTDMVLGTPNQLQLESARPTWNSVLISPK